MKATKNTITENATPDTQENATPETPQAPKRLVFTAANMNSSRRRLTGYELRLTKTSFVLSPKMYEALGKPSHLQIEVEDGKVFAVSSPQGFVVNDKGRFGSPNVCEEFQKATGFDWGQALPIGNELPDLDESEAEQPTE